MRYIELKKNGAYVVLAVSVIVIFGSYLHNTQKVHSAGYQIKSPPKKVVEEKYTSESDDLLTRVNFLDEKLDVLLTYVNSEKKGDSNKGKLENIEKFVRSLNQKLLFLEEQLTGIQVRHDAVQEVSGLTDDEREIQNSERMAQAQALYAETIVSQSVDVSWSASTETKVSDSLSQVRNKILTDNIVCKTTICRLDISRVEGTSDDEALEAFDMHVDWPGEMAMTYNPSTGEGTIYLSKVGESLPDLEQFN